MWRRSTPRGNFQLVGPREAIQRTSCKMWRPIFSLTSTSSMSLMGTTDHSKWRDAAEQQIGRLGRSTQLWLSCIARDMKTLQSPTATLTTGMAGPGSSEPEILTTTSSSSEKEVLGLSVSSIQSTQEIHWLAPGSVFSGDAPQQDRELWRPWTRALKMSRRCALHWRVKQVRL
jgi:hypothetical protein